MRRKAHKDRKRSNVGKVMTGMLFGSVLGATVGWLTAPAAGEETRRRIRGEVMSAREKARRGIENIESKARKLGSEAGPTQRLP